MTLDSQTLILAGVAIAAAVVWAWDYLPPIRWPESQPDPAATDAADLQALYQLERRGERLGNGDFSAAIQVVRHEFLIRGGK